MKLRDATLAGPGLVSLSRVTAVGFVVAMLSWSLNFYAPFVLALHQQHAAGWSPLQASAPVTVHFLASAMLLWGLERVHRRLGLAETLGCGIVASCIGMMAWANASAPLQAYAAAVVTGLGWAFTGSASIAAFIGDRAQPWSLATALNGATVGGFVFTPAFVFLIDAWGLSWAATAFAALALALAIPLLAPLCGKLAVPQAGAPVSYTALLSNPRYLWLGAAFSLFVFGQIGAASHLLTRMALVFDPQEAAFLMSLVLACGMAGRWLMAWALGWLDCRLAVALSFLIQAGAIVVMGIGQSHLILMLACAVYGLTIGNSILLLPIIAHKEFLPSERGKVIASVSSSNQLALSLAPFGVAFVFELTRGYSVPFIALALLQVLGLTIVLWSWKSTRGLDEVRS
jgi:predicted MFS family arabinose efflux permease